MNNPESEYSNKTERMQCLRVYGRKKSTVILLEFKILSVGIFFVWLTSWYLSVCHTYQKPLLSQHIEKKKYYLSATSQEQWNNVAFGIVNTINAWQKIFSRRKRLKVCPGRIPSKIPSHESVSCLAAQFRCCYWNNERKSTGQGPRLRDAVKRRTVQYWDLCGDCATKWSSGWLLL